MSTLIGDSSPRLRVFLGLWPGVPGALLAVPGVCGLPGVLLAVPDVCGLPGVSRAEGTFSRGASEEDTGTCDSSGVASGVKGDCQAS